MEAVDIGQAVERRIAQQCLEHQLLGLKGIDPAIRPCQLRQSQCMRAQIGAGFDNCIAGFYYLAKNIVFTF